MLLIYNELKLLKSALGLFLPSKELNSLGIHPGSQKSKIILHKVTIYIKGIKTFASWNSWWSPTSWDHLSFQHSNKMAQIPSMK